MKSFLENSLFQNSSKKLIISIFCSVWFCSTGQVANFVNNGSFEDTINIQNFIYYPRYWGATDSGKYFGQLLRGPNKVPKNSFGFQEAYNGKNIFVISVFSNYTYNNRGYLLNRLKNKLTLGHTYCVSFYVALTNESTHGIDAIGAYFGDSSLDTINRCTDPITYLIPQITNLTGNIITDTLSWTQITSTFVANGSEKYLMIGNFRSDANTNTSLTNTTYLPSNWAEYYLDAVSCIEMDVPAYAGPDHWITPGDSAYIGREPDFAIDPYCIWYQLPNMTTAIDTVSGFWVKPIATTTYIVRQELECGSVRWDTVVVYPNPVGLKKSKIKNEELKIYPVPASDFLELRIVHEEFFKESKTISIYNNLGMMLREEDVTLTEKPLKIKTDELPEGVYSLQLKSSGEGVICKRFVISR